MKPLFFFCLFITSLISAPVVTFTTCDSPTGESIRCHWMTNVSSTTVIKYGTVSGSLSTVLDRSYSGTYHAMLANAVTPATTYYIRACSTDPVDSVEVCSAEQTVVTLAATTVTVPILPTAADISWTAGVGGTTRTVGSNCLSASTGFQKHINDAVWGDTIVIPQATVNCTGQFILKDKGAFGASGILITTNSTIRPPTGVKTDSSRFGHSKIVRGYQDYLWGDSALLASLTGKVVLANYKPGAIVFELSTPTWNIKKAALAGSPRNITNATNATPIVVTTATAHGFSNGDTVCIDSVLGNRAANGCFVAAAVSSTNITLNLVGGANQIGSGVYTSGGQLQGLSWTVINHSATNAGPLSGSCATANSWGHNTSAAAVQSGIFRCGTDLQWYYVPTRLSNSDFWTYNSDPTAVILAEPGAHHYRFQGIDFADLPINLEPEYNYGPRNGVGAGGHSMGSVYFGANGSHHISFRQSLLVSDSAKWKMADSILVGGRTSDFEITGSSLACGSYHMAFIPENETFCAAISMQDSPGPILVENNTIKANFPFFHQDASTMGDSKNITFRRNIVLGMADFAHGSAYYAYAPRDIAMYTRQPIEFKSGRQILIAGNKIGDNAGGGFPISITPLSSAIMFGAQVGVTFGITVNSAGTVTPLTIQPTPTNLQINDRVSVVSGYQYGTGVGIYRINGLAPLTIKNLDGTSYTGGDLGANNVWCNIEGRNAITDATVVGNTITNAQVGVGTFGNSFFSNCYPAPSDRMSFRHNIFTLRNFGLTGGYYGVNASSGLSNTFQINSFVNWTTARNNTSTMPDTTSSIFDSPFNSGGGSGTFKNVSLSVQNNIFGAEDYGVWGEGISFNGLDVLNLRWPLGWTYNTNAHARTGGTIALDPTGQLYPTVAGLGFANVANFDFRFLKTSVYRTNSSDGFPMGADLQTVAIEQGRVTAPRATGGTGTITARWAYDGGAACSVDVSNNSFATYTRAISGSSGRAQSATVSALAAGLWRFQVLCPGTVDDTVTGTVAVR